MNINKLILESISSGDDTEKLYDDGVWTITRDKDGYLALYHHIHGRQKVYTSKGHEQMGGKTRYVKAPKSVMDKFLGFLRPINYDEYLVKDLEKVKINGFEYYVDKINRMIIDVNNLKSSTSYNKLTPDELKQLANQTNKYN